MIKELLKRRGVRLALVMVILVAPVALVVILLKPLVSKEDQNKFIKDYKLSSSFLQEDIAQVVERMRQNTEFRFYFTILPPDVLEQAVTEVYGVVNVNRGKEAHLRAVRQQQRTVRSLASLFLSLDYPENYIGHPDQYPKLNRLLWRFVYEEFILSVLGATYKSTYDLNFKFEWETVSLEAAGKANGLIQRLKAAHQLDRSSETAEPKAGRR